MSCGHCVKAVTQAVHEIYPQARVEVDLAAGTVQVDGADDAARVAHQIEDAGYDVNAVDGRPL
ncbi:heavy-metal-associated domain-containing protein [Pigmentiphaga soli]|uniref:Heavy-metal-associated domain-containing protein n=2 Tax=Pigmentiphaga soli TaxID=1007095 RepID=A0ABP8HN66_9BURK